MSLSWWAFSIVIEKWSCLRHTSRTDIKGFREAVGYPLWYVVDTGLGFGTGMSFNPSVWAVSEAFTVQPPQILWTVTNH